MLPPATSIYTRPVALTYADMGITDSSIVAAWARTLPQSLDTVQFCSAYPEDRSMCRPFPRKPTSRSRTSLQRLCIAPGQDGRTSEYHCIVIDT